MLGYPVDRTTTKSHRAVFQLQKIVFPICTKHHVLLKNGGLSLSFKLFNWRKSQCKIECLFRFMFSTHQTEKSLNYRHGRRAPDEYPHIATGQQAALVWNETTITFQQVERAPLLEWQVARRISQYHIVCSTFGVYYLTVLRLTVQCNRRVSPSAFVTLIFVVRELFLISTNHSSSHTVFSRNK